jgi:hypothetical protein
MKARLNSFKYPDGTATFNGSGASKGTPPSLTLSYVENDAVMLGGPTRKTAMGARKIFEKLAGKLGYKVVWEN